MNKSPAFQFYPRDWLGDPEIMLMEWDARAMHMHLICIAWTSSDACSVPDDDNILMRWLHVSDLDDWVKRLKPQIFNAWKKDGTDWVQSRLKRERIKQLENSEKRKKAANKRWGNDNKDGDASAVHEQCSSTSSSTSTVSKKSEKRFSDDDLKAANYILSKIKQLNPNHKEPNISKWADTVRLMIARDKRSHKEICELFAWANDDEFWKTNILSPVKLREQWDQLVIQRDHGKKSDDQKPDWEKIPKIDGHLEAWAKKNGFPGPRTGEVYPQYRPRLQRAVDERLKSKSNYNPED
jgi:uncharacterized protein YdaU (DUF1376 family)